MYLPFFVLCGVIDLPIEELKPNCAHWSLLIFVVIDLPIEELKLHYGWLDSGVSCVIDLPIEELKLGCFCKY